MRNWYQRLFVPTTPKGKWLRVLSMLLILAFLFVALIPGVFTNIHAKANPLPHNSVARSSVNLELLGTNSATIPHVAQRGVTISSLLQNNTANAISIRSGCVGPVVRLSSGSKVFSITYYAGTRQVNINDCIPSMLKIAAHSVQKLSYTYILQDAARPAQAIPNGTYQVAEELTYTAITGNPAKRYKKLSDGALIDTFPTTRASSRSQELVIHSQQIMFKATNGPTTAAADLLQSNSGNSTSVNPRLTFFYNVQASDLLLAVINCGNHSLGTPTDSLGNAWTAAATQLSGIGYKQGMYYAVAAASGLDTITFACNTRSSFAIVEFAGLKSTPFDQSGTARGTATPTVTPTFSTRQAYDIVIGFVGDNLTLMHSYTVTSPGYTEIQQNDSTRGNVELAYTDTSAQGTFTTSWQSSRRVPWGALQASFQVAPPPLTYPQNSQIGPFSPKVVIIDYNTSGQPSDGSAALAQRLIADYATGSNFHGTASSSVNFQVYATYTENNPPPILPGTSHGNLTGDYQGVFNKYNICGLAASQGVHFVWIWASGSEQGGINYSADFYEWVATGPTFYLTYGAQVPTCGSNTVVTFGFNYSRATAEALHSSGHYMENLLQFAFGPADYSGPGGTDMYDLFDGQVSRYAGYNGPLNTQTAECGDVHFPPNAVTSYDYGNNDVVFSECATYNPGAPSSELYAEVSAGSWQGIPCDPSLGFNSFDCNQESYLMWWMQNMPGYNNGVQDLYQYSMPNWWQYIVALDTTIRYNN